ncbi:CHRD domain-containing protein [Devosia geojensis]|nr:CHRD domain-containing protein [Devosia geojensis]
MTTRFMPAAGIALAAVLLAAGAARAETVNLHAELTGAAEVPANDSAGTGTLEGTFDTETMELTWTITYEGLTGEATAAHFHGPASPEENAGPVVPIEGDLASPIEGSATLTEEQATDLQGGMWYFNIHTEQYPDGEIRGQVMTGGAM